jgi:undecaprenyl pyrophosphate synthase
VNLEDAARWFPAPTAPSKPTVTVTTREITPAVPAVTEEVITLTMDRATLNLLIRLSGSERASDINWALYSALLAAR